MRLKLNFKNKGQMSTPNEYTDNFKSNLTCIFLSVGTKLKKTLCPRTRCIMLNTGLLAVKYYTSICQKNLAEP